MPKTKPADELGLTQFKLKVRDEGMPLDDGEAAMRVTNPRGEDPYQTEPELLDEPLDLPLDESPSVARDACPLTPQSITEAILFVGHPENEPISSRYIAALMRGVRPAEIDALIVELNASYKADGSPLMIHSIGNGYRMGLSDDYVSLRDAFLGKVKEAKLSQVAIDTLALIAYRQPISREGLRDIYDAAAPRIVGQLVRRGLVSLTRSESDRSAPAVLRTTDRFLKLFGLRSLDDLPRDQDAEPE
jgi:segregation and condensation protein B